MTKPNTERVKKYRDKMTAEGYARLEVTLGAGLIDRARELARQTQRDLWEVIQDALMAYLKIDHAAETGNAK